MTITEMLADLVALGWSQARIAGECGTSQATIFRLTQGANPRYAVGKAIEALHVKTVATSGPAKKKTC